MMEDYGWIQPGVKGVVEVMSDVDGDGDVKIRTSINQCGYVYVSASDLHPLPEPSPITAAQLRVSEAMVAYRRKPPGHTSGLYDEALTATDALIALITPPDPLAVVLDALREIEAGNFATKYSAQCVASIAIPILEAAIKGKQP